MLVLHRRRLGPKVAVLSVILAVHFRVVLDSLAPRNASNDLTTHAAHYESADREEYRRRQNYPSAPLHVRKENEDINEEREEGDDQGRQTEDQQREEVFRRVRGFVHVGRDTENKQYQRHERSDRVDDQQVCERIPSLAG